jgi:DNA-binding transcriptional LysR family regulator
MESYLVYNFQKKPTTILLYGSMGCSYRMIFEDSLKSAGVFPLDKIEFSSNEAIKQCVIAGLGVALLPEMVVKKDIIEGKMKEIPWKGSEPSLFTQIAWHKDKWITPPLEALINLTRQIFFLITTSVEKGFLIIFLVNGKGCSN